MVCVEGFDSLDYIVVLAPSCAIATGENDTIAILIEEFQALQQGGLLDGLATLGKGFGVALVARVGSTEQGVNLLGVVVPHCLLKHLQAVVLPVVEVVVNHIHNGNEHIGILAQLTGGLNGIPQPAILASKLGCVVILTLNLSECSGAYTCECQDRLVVVGLKGGVNLIEAVEHNEICRATVNNPAALREYGEVIHVLCNVGNLVVVGLVDVVVKLGHRYVAILDVVDRLHTISAHIGGLVGVIHSIIEGKLAGLTRFERTCLCLFEHDVVVVPIDEVFHSTIERLHPGVVPRHFALAVGIFTIRPQDDTIEVLIASLQHNVGLLLGNELHILGVLGVVVVVRPNIAHNLLVGVVLPDVGNGGLQVLNPLVHIRRVGIERRIQHVAHLTNANTALVVELGPAVQDFLFGPIFPVTTIDVEVARRCAIVTNGTIGNGLLEHIEHDAQLLFDIREVFFVVPALNVKTDGLHTRQFANVDLLFDFVHIQLLVGYQESLIDKAERRNHIALEFGLTLVEQTIIDGKLLFGTRGAVLATFGHTTGAVVRLGVLTSCQSENHRCDGT